LGKALIVFSGWSKEGLEMIKLLMRNWVCEANCVILAGDTWEWKLNNLTIGFFGVPLRSKAGKMPALLY
jgi:hypothetical protein